MFLKLKTDLDQMILIENYYNVSQKKNSPLTLYQRVLS